MLVDAGGLVLGFKYIVVLFCEFQENIIGEPVGDELRTLMLEESVP